MFPMFWSEIVNDLVGDVEQRRTERSVSWFDTINLNAGVSILVVSFGDA
jgi:hypothetical protein